MPDGRGAAGMAGWMDGCLKSVEIILCISASLPNDSRVKLADGNLLAKPGFNRRIACLY